MLLFPSLGTRVATAPQASELWEATEGLENAAKMGAIFITLVFCDPVPDRKNSGAGRFTVAPGFRHFSPLLGGRHDGGVTPSVTVEV